MVDPTAHGQVVTLKDGQWTTVSYTTTGALPVEPELPPVKEIEQMTLDDYRKGVANVFDSYRLLP